MDKMNKLQGILKESYNRKNTFNQDNKTEILGHIMGKDAFGNLILTRRIDSKRERHIVSH